MTTYFQNVLPVPGLHTVQTTRHSSLESACQDIPISPTPIIMNQVHGSDWALVTPKSAPVIANTDALVTMTPHCPIAVKSADCLPIIIFHPQPLVGVVHAGRKGTQSGIITRLISELLDTYQLSDEFTFWFGPAICGQCYEINRDTGEHFDLIAENHTQIQTLLPTPTIHYSDHCTACENDLFFSYRKGDAARRLYTIAWLG